MELLGQVVWCPPPAHLPTATNCRHHDSVVWQPTILTHFMGGFQRRITKPSDWPHHTLPIHSADNKKECPDAHQMPANEDVTCHFRVGAILM